VWRTVVVVKVEEEVDQMLRVCVAAEETRRGEKRRQVGTGVVLLV